MREINWRKERPIRYALGTAVYRLIWWPVVALVERALPGSRCLVGTRGMKGDRARAAIIPAHGRMVGAKHRTPAIALCIALLKALQPKEQPNG